LRDRGAGVGPLLNYLLIPIGFALLFFGGDGLVRGAVGFARRYGVSPMMIGATVVAYGTTMPELFVSVDAALAGSPGISIGNVVGSNICNFLLILGVCAIIWPISLARGASLGITSAMLAGATLLFIVVGWNGQIARWQGVLMILMLAGLTFYNFQKERHNGSDDVFVEEAEEFAEKAPRTVGRAALVFLLGIVGVLFGADFLVKGAVALARDFGVPEEVIGLTVVAVGTSLPELATAVIAAWRRHSDVALGTVFGANIYNILGIMGVVATISPVPVPPQMLRFDLWVLLGITCVLGLWVRYFKRISRLSGAVFLALYAAYVIWLYTPGAVS
jgi:cation:H+ antiporter